ncbi:MAG: YjfB family protein [Planctomycetota bacterium]
MSAIPPAVQQVLTARNEATHQQIDTAVLKKTLDNQQQTGDAINQLLEQAVTVQKQLSQGRLDVRV